MLEPMGLLAAVAAGAVALALGAVLWQPYRRNPAMALRGVMALTTVWLVFLFALLGSVRAVAPAAGTVLLCLAGVYVALTTQPLPGPPGLGVWLATLAWCSYSIWAGSDAGLVGRHALLWPLGALAMQLAWTTRLAISVRRLALETPEQAPPRPDRLAARWVLGPAAVCAVLLAVRSDALLQARLAISRDALAAFAADVRAGADRLDMPRRVGLFEIVEAQVEGGVVRLTTQADANSQAGLLHADLAAASDLAQDAANRRLAGPWWRWQRETP